MTDPLDRILQRDAREPIADAGFSHRVMAALPPRRPAPRAWLMPALVLGSTALGSVLAVALSPAAGSLLQGFQDLVQLRGLTQAAIAGLAISGTLLVSVVILATDLE
jgi:hypothetical protein